MEDIVQNNEEKAQEPTWLLHYKAQVCLVFQLWF